MTNLEKELALIEQQKKTYKILLNKSKYQQELRQALWESAAELASRFDIVPDKVTFQLQQEKRQALTNAYNMVRMAPKNVLEVPFIKDIHGALIASENPRIGGVFRTMPARWRNSTIILSNSIKIPTHMDNLVDGINQNHIPAFYWEEAPNKEFQKLSHNPVMQAIEANYNTVAIHPFNDGNKRTGRLVSAWILDKNGHIPLSIYDREDYISGMENYYETRTPHVFYNMMCDQMRQSYDKAIQEVQSTDTLRVYMGQNIKRNQGK